MKSFPLTSGAYSARSIIANAQRCVNLFPEANPQGTDAPVAVTHYLTPGLRLLLTAPNGAAWRGLYTASNGILYGVAGIEVYEISSGLVCTEIGAVKYANSHVSMRDNGLDLIIVDGTKAGYFYTFATRVFATIVNAAFYGADRVEYVDTFFVFNRPGTAQWYLSLALAVDFDPLDIAAKSGAPDPIVSTAVLHREVWLIGAKSCEVFYNSGGTDFAFSALPGAYIDHGCAAKYSIAKSDLNLFWISQDEQGQAIVVKTKGYQVERISNHALEAEFRKYPKISDATAFIYQQDGHTFYVLTFPSADRTWCFDQATGEWHERASFDANGVQHRHRAAFHANAYGLNIVADYANGNLYAFDPEVFTDNGQPITRIRSWPHLTSNSNRVTYSTFSVDMEVGSIANTMAQDAIEDMKTDFSIDFSTDFATDGTKQIGADNPALMVSLRWSDNAGRSFGNAVQQTLGATGAYQTNISWSRLGMARDRVFELSWSCNAMTALNGAFIEAKPHRS